MIDKDYLSDFKKSDTYLMLKKGIIKRQLKEVLLGEGEYGMPYLPIVPLTDTSMVIIALHLLAIENKVTNEEINNAFDTIKINRENVCLLLDYIETYLLYRKLESILKIDYQNLFERIIKDEDQYKNLDCYNGFVLRVYKAIEEQNHK